MITKDEIQELLHSTETYRVERTTSTDERSKGRGQTCLYYALQEGRRREPTGDMDKFQEAICASAMKTLGYVNMFNRGVGQVQTDLKENGNQPAEFNVNLITAFKVDVRVSQSYTKEDGGKVGGDIVENVVENITENIVDSIVEKLSTTRAKIVRIIWKNPNATAQSISKEINIASRNVQEHLRKLQEQGVIRRIGPDKGGHWEIIAP